MMWIVMILTVIIGGLILVNEGVNDEN